MSWWASVVQKNWDAIFNVKVRAYVIKIWLFLLYLMVKVRKCLFLLYLLVKVRKCFVELSWSHVMCVMISSDDHVILCWAWSPDGHVMWGMISSGGHVIWGMISSGGHVIWGMISSGGHITWGAGQLSSWAPDLWSKGHQFESWQERQEIFFSRVNFLCQFLFLYSFHLHVTTVACKRSLSICQKLRWQVAVSCTQMHPMHVALNKVTL